MTLTQHAKAALCAVAISVSLTLCCVVLAILACARAAFPEVRALRTAMNGLYRLAVTFDDCCLERIAGVRWQLPTLDLDPEQTCIVLCNHRSFSDVLVVQSVIAKNGPVVTFLAKRELAYVPVLGIIFWAFGFPMLERRARGAQTEAARRQADHQRISAACAAIRRAPAAILTFAEGTRFTHAKHRRTASPYQHLLAPKPGGFSAIYDSLADLGAIVVDLTLAYNGEVTFWRFLGGAAPVSASATVYGPGDLADQDRPAWLKRRWEIKDRELAGGHGRDPLAGPGVAATDTAPR